MIPPFPGSGVVVIKEVRLPFRNVATDGENSYGVASTEQPMDPKLKHPVRSRGPKRVIHEVMVDLPHVRNALPEGPMPNISEHHSRSDLVHSEAAIFRFRFHESEEVGLAGIWR